DELPSEFPDCQSSLADLDCTSIKVFWALLMFGIVAIDKMLLLRDEFAPAPLILL
ncbi:hypothetical protein LTR54_018528, partial [Friedmanniomyces endolithicus]